VERLALEAEILARCEECCEPFPAALSKCPKCGGKAEARS
jgi:rRNA maturation endonuclease Nob1